MNNGEDEILMHELEGIVENAADITAQRIIDEIHQLTARLKSLWPDARIRQTNDREGQYLRSEIDRLNKQLQSRTEQFVRLYNQQLESASSFIRPNFGNPPD